MDKDCFNKNLEKQEECFNNYLNYYRDQIRNGSSRWEAFPFSDFSGFQNRYIYLRAGLASLLKNPDTMYDPDFRELCETWKHQQFGKIEFERLEELYNKLMEKQVFQENQIFKNLYGEFVKSVYQLFSDTYYTDQFFGIDE